MKMIIIWNIWIFDHFFSPANISSQMAFRTTRPITMGIGCIPLAGRRLSWIYGISPDCVPSRASCNRDSTRFWQSTRLLIAVLLLALIFLLTPSIA
jgi:hypothetical protein